MGCKFSRPCSTVVEFLVLREVLWGRHLDLRGNLIKAMMVMNWLNMLEVENF